MADDVTDPKPLRGGRQRANHIQVHRIELGLKEREYAEQFLAGNMIGKVGTVGGPVMAGLGIMAAGIGTYFTLKKVYAWGEEVAESVDNWLNRERAGFGTSDDPSPTWTVKEAVVGKGTHTYPDGTEITNPFAGVPVLGSLMSSGMNIGMAFNPLKNHPDYRG